jgi:hypothetical protein
MEEEEQEEAEEEQEVNPAVFSSATVLQQTDGLAKRLI